MENLNLLDELDDMIADPYGLKSGFGYDDITGDTGVTSASIGANATTGGVIQQDWEEQKENRGAADEARAEKIPQVPQPPSFGGLNDASSGGGLPS